MPPQTIAAIAPRRVRRSVGSRSGIGILWVRCCGIGYAARPSGVPHDVGHGAVGSFLLSPELGIPYLDYCDPSLVCDGLNMQHIVTLGTLFAVVSMFPRNLHP